jgi:peptidyl-prolyl cis-trans isomerase D
MKKEKLKELAKKLYKNFKGKTSDFITIKDYDKLTDLGKDEAKAFVSELFKQNSRNGYIVVDDENVILYNIVEQKLLHKTHTESKKIITGIKAKSFEDNLLKYLQDRYKIEIYYKGL